MEVFINFIFDVLQRLAEFTSLITWPFSSLINQYVPILADNTLYQGFLSSNFGATIMMMTPLSFFSIGGILLILVLHLVHLINVVSG